MITNGSFENGPGVGHFVGLPSGSTAIPGWTVGGAGIDFVGSYWEASSGDRCIDLNRGSGGVISTSVDTEVSDEAPLNLLLLLPSVF